MADEQGQKAEEVKPEGEKLVASPEYAAELRAEAKQYRLKMQAMEAELNKIKGQTERQQLEAKGNYEQALNTALAQVSELEKKAQIADKYQEALKKTLDIQRAEVPAHIITLLDRLDPADQLEWLAENAASIKQPAAQEAQKSGVASFNPPGNKSTLTDRERIANLNKQRGVTSPFG